MACFVIGLLTGAAPLIMYQRRFNYEAVGSTNNDSHVENGNSSYQYQMPDIRHNVRETFSG
jgi:hypothetical protein